MFDALLGNALSHLAVAEDLVGFHETYAASKESAQETRVKQYAVAACVMRVYGIYEHFVETAIADYLDGIPELVAYADLPEGMRSEYRQGISHILSKLDTTRYSHLSHENIIRWYHEALTGTPHYRFVTEALTRHEQNLRLNTLTTLVSRIGVDFLHEWLAHCPHLARLYDDDGRVVERVEAELKEFIAVRNDAAHGLLETLQAPNILLRQIEVVRAITISVAACLRAANLQMKLDTKSAIQIGKVTEVLPKVPCAILTLNPGGQLAVGDVVSFRGRSLCFEQRVLSLRSDDSDVESFGPVAHLTEIGVRFEQLPRENASVIRHAVLAAAPPSEQTA